MKKRVLVISQLPIWDISNNTGKEVFYLTMKRFAKEYELSIIAPGEAIGVGETYFYSIDNKFQKTINTIPIIGYFYNFIYLFLFKNKIHNIIKSNNLGVDLVYTVGQWSTFAANKIFGNKTKIVNRYFGVAWNETKFNSLKERIRFFLKLKCYKLFGDLIVMTNDGTKGDVFLNRIGADMSKVKFLINGVEVIDGEMGSFKQTFFYENHLEEDTKILLTVSRLAKWKRVDRAIFLTKKLIENNFNVALIVVGRGEEEKHLKSMCEDLKISDKIIFVGAIKREHLFKYYKLSDIFLSFYDYSNAGNPLFEAMKFKKCIATIANGDTSSFINEECSIIEKKFSTEVFYSKISKLLENEDQIRILGDKAYDRSNIIFKNWKERIQLEIDALNKLIDSQ